MAVVGMRKMTTLVGFLCLTFVLLVACVPTTSPTEVPPINIPLINISGSPTAPGALTTPDIAGTSQPEATPTRAVQRTSIPSRTPTLTSTALPTETMLPSPTETMAVVWAAGRPQAVVLEQFRGQWAKGEQKLIGNLLLAPDLGVIAQAKAPRFTLEAVQSGGQASMANLFTTSPNGRWTVYGSVPLDEYQPDWPEYSTLTRLNNQDNRVDSLLSAEGRLHWLSFPGWMDENTLSVADYAGAGFFRYTLLNASGNSVVSRVQARGPAGGPSSLYLPIAEENGGPYRLFVLTRSQQSEPYVALSGPTQFARGFPPEYIAPDMHVLFKDWQPGTEKMLVQAFFYNRTTQSTTHSLLMLWDVDPKIVDALIYSALDGRYSPNGQWLAFMTLGPAPLYPEGTPSFDLGFLVSNGQAPYLQLMDSNSRVVRLSLPVVTTIDPSGRYVLNIYDTPLSFSPDSRYLAFLTPGMLVIDQTGKLVVLQVSQESVPYLSVLDLYTLQPLLSTPAGGYRDKYFSTDSRWLAFQGNDSNWYLMRLAMGYVQALSIAGGERLYWNGWSSDGSHFSFYEPAVSGLGRTLVFSTP